MDLRQPTKLKLGGGDGKDVQFRGQGSWEGGSALSDMRMSQIICKESHNFARLSTCRAESLVTTRSVFILNVQYGDFQRPSLFPTFTGEKERTEPIKVPSF